MRSTRSVKTSPLRHLLVSSGSDSSHEGLTCGEGKRVGGLVRRCGARSGACGVHQQEILHIMVRCSKTRCPSDFVQTFYVVRGVSKPHKTCPKCRAGIKRYLQTDKGKEAKRRYLDSDAREVQISRQQKSEAHKESRAKWSKLNGIQAQMSMMVSGMLQTSNRVKEAAGFNNRMELVNHLASTFDGNMTQENYGLGPGKWSIGHRIAKSYYDPSNAEDERRCFNRANMFAQWTMDNQKAHTKLPPEDVLLQLKPFWPVAWQGRVPNRDVV